MRGCSGGRQEQMIPIFISMKDQPAMGAKDSADPICGLANVMKAGGQLTCRIYGLGCCGHILETNHARDAGTALQFRNANTRKER
jgi:hypothetical protein